MKEIHPLYIPNATLTKNFKGKGVTLISWKVKGLTFHHWKSKNGNKWEPHGKNQREREREGDRL